MQKLKISTGRIWTVLALSLGLACAATSARADLVLGIADGSATPGSSTNSFDVTLTNTGMRSVDIAGFSFEISTTSNEVTLTDVNIGTQGTYIFNGNSLFGPDITNVTSPPLPPTAISASDNYATPNAGVTLSSGQTLDLGHVLFSLAQNTPLTPIQLMFSGFPVTSLNAPDGYTFQHVTDAPPGALTIPVVASAVPEPGSLLLAIQGLLLTGSIVSGVRGRAIRRSKS
jgi:hypothetical protein